MGEYTEIVSYRTAKLLKSKCYSESYYAGGDVTVTWDNYLGTEQYKEGELITDGDNWQGLVYGAPYYCDVIDWLRDNFKIVIELIPAFTFALNSNVAYYYKVYRIDKDNAKLSLLFEENMEMSSFKLAIDDIIEKLISENFINLDKDEN